MIGGLLPIVILAAIVYGVVRLISRRNATEGEESPEGDVREIVVRIVRLALLAAAVALTAEGIAGLLAEALPRVDNEITRDALGLAQALSFTIVGVPALWGLIWWTRREMDGDHREAGSVVWAAFLAGMLLAALITAVVNIDNLLDWLLSDGRFDPRALGRSVVWSAVTAGFWWLNRQRPAARLDDHTPMYLLLGSTFGLAMGGGQLWELLRALIRPAADRLWGDADVLVEGDRRIALLLALAAVSVGVWIWFWWFNGRRSARTERWYAYVLLVGVLSGVVTAVAATGILINLTLQWLLGDPRNDTAALHFESAPGALSALVVGGLIWAHHRGLLTGRRGSRAEPDRVYDYLGAATGLVLTAAAVTIVVAQLIYAIATAASTDVVTESVANTLIYAATFALIGVPLLALFWRRTQRYDDLDELRSPSRRVYLIGVLGISAAATLVALVISLTVFLEAITTSSLSGDTFVELRYGVGVIVSALTIAAYHALVYREDRDSVEAGELELLPPPGPEPAAGKKPQRDRVVATTDIDEARRLLNDPDGPDAVVLTRSDDVTLADIVQMET